MRSHRRRDFAVPQIADRTTGEVRRPAPSTVFLHCRTGGWRDARLRRMFEAVLFEAALDFVPPGMTEISRRLSAATPPVRDTMKVLLRSRPGSKTALEPDQVRCTA